MIGNVTCRARAA